MQQMCERKQQNGHGKNRKTEKTGKNRENRKKTQEEVEKKNET